MSFILSVAFVGALIAGLARLSPYVATAACIITSVKTQFSDHFKTILISQSRENLTLIIFFFISPKMA